MKILDFLYSVSKQQGELTQFHFLSDVIRDEDTTTLTVNTFALVDSQANIKGFECVTEFHNHFEYTGECPCLVDVVERLAFPPAAGKDIATHIRDFVIQYQDKMLKTMLESDSTHSFTSMELDALKAWDRKELLQSPEELNDVLSYIGLSYWAAKKIEQHVSSFLFAAAG